MVTDIRETRAVPAEDGESDREILNQTLDPNAPMSATDAALMRDVASEPAIQDLGEMVRNFDQSSVEFSQPERASTFVDGGRREQNINVSSPINQTIPLWRVDTGELLPIPTSIANAALNGALGFTTLPDGREVPVFSQTEPTHLPKPSLKCWLHVDEPESSRWLTQGFKACTATHFFTPNQVRTHVQGRHKRAYEAIQDYRHQERETEWREQAKTQLQVQERMLEALSEMSRVFQDMQQIQRGPSAVAAHVHRYASPEVGAACTVDENCRATRKNPKVK